MPNFENKKPNWGKSNTWTWEGCNCHWRILGERNEQAILLIHGFGASSDHWRNNAHFFAEAGFRVYAIDLIGFGKSEQPSSSKIKRLDNKFWSEQIADFLREVVLKNKSEKAILVGNSLGGLTALTTSRFHPGLVSALIAAPLPDPAFMQSVSIKLPRWLTKLRRYVIKLFFKLLPLEIFIPLIVKTRILKSALQLAYYQSIKSDVELLRIVKQPAKRSTAARALRAMCIGMSTRNIVDTAPFLLKNIAQAPNRPPILLVWGRQDKLVPLIIGRKIIKQYPWLELLILESTGHCPHDESPKNFNQYVLNWLKLNL